MQRERIAKLSLIALLFVGCFLALVGGALDPRLVLGGTLLGLLLGLPLIERVFMALEGGRVIYRARRRVELLSREARRALKRYAYRIPEGAKQETLSALGRADAALAARDEAGLSSAAEALEALAKGELAFAKKSALREYAEAMASGVFLVLLFRALVAEGYEIPSGSMLPTLVVGDYVEVSKSAYGIRLPLTTTRLWSFSEPARGDVVVFRHPNPPRPEDEGKNLIKRVVAVAGDEISIEEGVLTVNGEKISREPDGAFEYLEAGENGDLVRRKALRFTEDLFGLRHTVLYEAGARQGCDLSRSTSCWPRYQGEGPFGEGCRWPARFCVPPEDREGAAPFKVPEGYVFVMGDNRDDSEDSRYWGPLPVDHILGKALFIPFSRGASGLEWGRFFLPVR